MKTYIVTAWKHPEFSTSIEVQATSAAEAIELAREQLEEAEYDDSGEWGYIDQLRAETDDDPEDSLIVDDSDLAEVTEKRDALLKALARIRALARGDIGPESLCDRADMIDSLIAEIAPDLPDDDCVAPEKITP